MHGKIRYKLSTTDHQPWTLRCKISHLQVGRRDKDEKTQYFSKGQLGCYCLLILGHDLHSFICFSMRVWGGRKPWEPVSQLLVPFTKIPARVQHG